MTITMWILIVRNNFVSASRFTSVDLADVLAINEINNDHYYLSNNHYIKKKSKTSNSSSVLDISLLRKCYSFEIHYSVRHKSKYIVERATFCTSDFPTVTKWVGKIKEKLKSKFWQIFSEISIFVLIKKKLNRFRKRISLIYQSGRWDQRSWQCKFYLKPELNWAKKSQNIYKYF